MDRSQRTYTLLVAAGVVPFAVGGALAAAGVEALPIVGTPEALTLSYGLGIISFLTGVLWATNLYLEQRSPPGLFVASNVIFLAVWFSYLIAGTRGAAIVQAAAFALLLLIDYRLLQSAVIGRHYFRVRSAATLVAVVSLLALLLK